MKFLIHLFALSVVTAGHYETPKPYSGPLAGVLPLVPKAASGGLVPKLSPEVAAALAEFASLGGIVQPAPPSSGSSSYPSSSYSLAPVSSTYISDPFAGSSGSDYSYSGPLAGVPALVPKAASGGLVPQVSPEVAAALAEFASLGGTIQPAGPSSGYSSYPSSSYSSASVPVSSGSDYSYSGPLAGDLPLVPQAASGGLVPDFSHDVAAARAQFASLGGAVNPAPAGYASPSYGSSGSSGFGSLGASSYGPSASVSGDSSYGYSGPLAGVPILVPAAASGALVPADEAAVAAAKAEHQAAKARAANGW